MKKKKNCDQNLSEEQKYKFLDYISNYYLAHKT